MSILQVRGANMNRVCPCGTLKALAMLASATTHPGGNLGFFVVTVVLLLFWFGVAWF